MPKSLLVLGGTRFVGRAVVERAVAEGWEVTLLNRGTRPQPEGVAQIVVADRTAPGALDALPERRWDAVVDTWPSDPEAVRLSAGYLRGRVGRYVYVSSRSVYAWPAAENADETAPLVDAPPPGVAPDYAQSKRMAEDAVLAAFPTTSLIARAGVLLGPHEHPGRLPWWLGRLAHGGDVAVPGTPGVDLQYLDARDLAAWLVRAISSRMESSDDSEIAAIQESRAVIRCNRITNRSRAVDERLTGTFNLVGPIAGATMGELIDLCLAVTGSAASIHWIDPAIVIESGITPWTSLPLWLPPGERHAALYRGNVDAAHAAGLVERPLAQTVADTWAWMNSAEGREACAAITLGMTQAEENGLLEMAGVEVKR